MQIPRTWIAAGLLLGMILGSTVGYLDNISEELPVRSIAERAQGAAVLVYSGSFNLSIGSGAAWDVEGRVRVTTAAHVLTSPLFDSEPVIEHDGVRYRASVLYVNPVSDFAVLGVEEPVFFSPLPWKVGAVSLGGPIIYSGSPNMNRNIVLRGTFAGTLNENHHNGEVLAYIFNVFAWHGSSGSAILDERGGLIGSISHIDAASMNDDSVVLLPALAFTHQLDQLDILAVENF